MIALELFCFLCFALGFTSASKANYEEAYVIGLLADPIYDNVTWPVAPPNIGSLQSIKVGIGNYGETADEVAFHAYLPDYAQMTSFSMQSEGATYLAKKTSHHEAHQVMEKARKEGGNAAMYFPQPMLDHYDNEIQTAVNTVHIKPNKKMTFDLQYKETLKDMKEAGVKILNRARVAFDFYGSTVEDMFGELYSPNYPEGYPDSADVTWWVRAPKGKVVRLNVLDLDIESCCDRLTIYDGNSVTGESLAILTGSLSDVTNAVVQSTKSSVLLHLTSDCSEAKSGFHVTVKAVATEELGNHNVTSCSGNDVLTDWSGSIQSPNYPSAYDPNTDCSWTIQFPVDKYLVNLTLVDFHLETNYDFLYIYDGSSSSSPLIASLSGHETGQSFLSSSRFMHLRFSSDSVGNWQGFALNYTSVYFPYADQPTTPPYANSSACSGGEHINTVPGINTYVTSPGYSSYYDNNLQCSWLIYSQSRVKLSDIYIDLAYDGDHLVIFDGPSESSPMLKNFTGYQSPSSFSSTGNYMLVQFITDDWGTDNGFTFYASTRDNSTSLTAYSSYNYFYSPNYSYSNYHNNAYYTWTITSYYSYYYVTAQITHYELESCCDYLRFYDGSSSNSPELTFPGVNSYLYSSGRYLYVTFTSDSSVTSKGFQVRYYYRY